MKSRVKKKHRDMAGPKEVKERFMDKFKSKGMAVGLILLVLAIAVIFVMTVALPRKDDRSTTTTTLKTKTQERENNKVKPKAKGTDTLDSTSSAGSPDHKPENFKDPFAPLSDNVAVTGNPKSGKPTSGNNALSGGVAVGSNEDNEPGGAVTLALMGVIDQNGVKYAVIIYRGREYIATDGDQIENSPFQVVKVNYDSVALLYGDDLVELRVGDEIIK